MRITAQTVTSTCHWKQSETYKGGREVVLVCVCLCVCVVGAQLVDTTAVNQAQQANELT